MKRKIFFLQTIFAFIFPVVVYAQSSISSATFEVNEPIPGSIEDAVKKYFPPILPPLQQEETPILPQEGSFFVKTIELTGAESFPAEEFDHLLQRYENREVTLQDLHGLARDIEAEFLDRGVIAACVIPPQDVMQGTIKIQVIEAKMGEIIINEHKYFKKSRLEHYWKPEPNKTLRYDEIAKSLYLMNKNPDRTVRATLKAGKVFQTTDVYLDAQTRFPVHLSTSVDNEGAGQTGVIRQNYGLRHNNFFGLDDTLFTGYAFGNEFDSVYAYHSVPVGDSGASLFYGYNYNKATPREEFRTLGVDSRSRNITVQLHQDLFRKADYAGKVYAVFDSKDKQTKTNTGTLNRDRLRILRLGANFIERRQGRLTQIIPEISQGLNILGARKLNEYSSRGAKNIFSKFNLSLDHQQILFRGLNWSTRFKGQWASNKLAPQEGFFLGGIDSIRGYPSGDFTADNALQVNCELTTQAYFIPAGIPLPLTERSLRESINMLAFYDVGWGWKRSPDPTDEENAQMQSVGAGIRLLPVDNAVVRLEWGFPLGDSTVTEEGHSRFHFGIDFNLPF